MAVRPVIASGPEADSGGPRGRDGAERAGVAGCVVTPDLREHRDPRCPAGGTAAGVPVSGAEISEEAVEEAVEPDDSNIAHDVDGPRAGHA